MPKENKIRYVILGMLSHEALSGYDIKKMIEVRISHFYDASFGQIYPELAKLEEQGLVNKQVEVQERKPPRNVYTITDIGRTELRRWLEIPVQEETIRYEILLKMFFGGQIEPGVTIRNLRMFRERNAAKLQMLKYFEQELRGLLGDNLDHLYYLLTVRFGLHVIQSHITWAEEAIRLLETQGKTEDTGKGAER